MDGTAADFDLEARNAQALTQVDGLFCHHVRIVEAQHVADLQLMGKTAQEAVHRCSDGFAPRIPHGHVDRGLRRRVADGPAQSCPHLFSVQD